MRDIKFKFVIDGKHLSKPYTIDEIIKISEDQIFEDMEVCNCNINESNNHCEGDCIRFDNSEITDKVQYTGRKDKNGVEIYEVDILKINGWSTTFKVIWNEDYASFAPEKIETDLGRKMNYIPIGCEVIGNIYENQELIK